MQEILELVDRLGVGGLDGDGGTDGGEDGKGRGGGGLALLFVWRQG